MKKTGIYVAIGAGVLVVAAISWLYLANYLDRDKPTIKINQTLVAIGKSKDVSISFSDTASGLSHIKVEMIQDNQTRTLADETLPSRSIREKTIQIPVNTTDLKMVNGPATLHITATDASLFKNKSVLAQQIMIDRTPPKIEILTSLHYINQGGTGFVAYRLSKPAASSGIYVNDLFFPGVTIRIQNRPVGVAYFAVPLNAGAKTGIAIYARDDAGNEAKTSLPCVIKAKKFRADTLALSDDFLQRKMPEFQTMIPELQSLSLADVFTHINTTLREDNNKTILHLCSKSTDKQLWEGAFLRMRNAKTMAMFGDQRTYLINGKPSGASTHLGVDLASVAGTPIEASNSGLVVFADALGIYGNTVIIDHGLGVFSLYAHLSAIETSVAQHVKKGTVIGRSGLTGLAGGDHLHYSILVSGQFVNPIEWWDPNWIKDNIDSKMAL